MPQRQIKELARDAERVVVGKPDNSASIALLEGWAKADATTDASEIAKAEEELAEFKANLNANRPADRPVFP
jgi:hypothetical protein